MSFFLELVKIAAGFPINYFFMAHQDYVSRPQNKNKKKSPYKGKTLPEPTSIEYGNGLFVRRFGVPYHDNPTVTTRRLVNIELL